MMNACLESLTGDIVHFLTTVCTEACAQAWVSTKTQPLTLLPACLKLLIGSPAVKLHRCKFLQKMHRHMASGTERVLSLKNTRQFVQ